MRNDFDSRKEACKRCMKLLEYAPRTEKQLRDRLGGEDFSEEDIDSAIAYVKSFGYVNDRRFAEEYIRCRINRKSLRRLILELAEKGISRELAEDAAEEFAGEEREAIRYLVEKRIKSKPLNENEDVFRLIQYMTGKGFSYDAVKRVVWDYKNAD